VKDALERFRVTVTGRWAVSIRIYVLTVPFAFAINLERENILNPGNFTRSIAICLAGEFASYLYLFIAQATLLRHRRERLQRLSTCAFVWFSTGTVKGIFLIIYAIWAYGYEADFLARTILPTLFAGISGALLAFYFGTIDRRRIESKALNSLDDFLAIDQGLGIENNVKARMESIHILRETLMPLLEKLENTISGISRENTKNNEQITSLAQQSKKLAEAIEFQSNAISLSKAKKPTKRILAREISFFSGLIPTVISVRVTLIVVVLGMTTGQMTRNGVLGVASGLVGAAVLGLVLISLRMYSKKLAGRKLTYLVMASFPIVFLTQFIYVSNLSRIGFDLENPYIPWYSAIKTIYGFYIACIIASLVVDTSTEYLRLSNESDELRRSITRLDHDQEVLTDHIFATRFGTIQGKITGVTMALHLALNNSSGTLGSEKFDEILAGARKLLSDARMEIDALSQEFRSA